MAITPEEGERRLKSLMPRLLQWAVRELKRYGDVVAAVAVTQFMRPDPGGGPRQPDDHGSLRSISGRFKAGLIAARYRGRMEGIRKVIGRRMRASLIMGSRVPYFLRQELGFEGIDSLGRFSITPARPTLGPAVKQTYPTLRRTLRQNMAKEIVKHMQGR